MCFSAGASFGASAVLSIIGTAAIMKARTVPQGLFAGIPLIFSMQQLAEGLLWLSLSDTDLAAWKPFFMYTFLVFALMVWPLWVPLTLSMLEKDATRKKTLRLFIVAGAIAATAAGCAMLFYPVDVILLNHHLHYIIDIPAETKTLIALFALLYVAATILTSFVSSVRRMKWLGSLFLISYSVTLIFYSEAVASVWCYFAALLSLVVYWIISGLHEGDSSHYGNLAQK